MKQILKLIILFLFISMNIYAQSDTIGFSEGLKTLDDSEKYGCLAKAMIYHNTQDYENAITYYNKAIKLHEDYLENKDKGLKFVITIDDALASTVNDDPFGTGQVYIYRGGILLESEKYDSALVDYRKAVEINSQNDECYYNLAVIYMEKNEFQKALAYVDSAIFINPNDGIYLINRAYVYMELKKYDKATIDLKNAIEVDSNEPYSYKMLGDIEVIKGDTLKACDYWHKAKILDLEIEEWEKCNCEISKN